MGEPQYENVTTLVDVALRFGAVMEKLTWLVIRFLADPEREDAEDDELDLWYESMEANLMCCSADDDGKDWDEFCAVGILQTDEYRSATVEEREFIIGSVIGEGRTGLVYDLGNVRSTITAEGVDRYLVWTRHFDAYENFVNGGEVPDAARDELKKTGDNLIKWGAKFRQVLEVHPEKHSLAGDVLSVVEEGPDKALIALEAFACFLPTAEDAKDEFMMREAGDQPTRADVWLILLTKQGDLDVLKSVEHLVDLSHSYLNNVEVLLNAGPAAVDAYNHYRPLSQRDLLYLVKTAYKDDLREYCRSLLSVPGQKRGRDDGGEGESCSSSSSTKRPKPLD
jgi:hypothetical protein